MALSRRERGRGICARHPPGSSRFSEGDDVLRNAALGRVGDLQLGLDRPQNFPRLGGYRVGAVGLNVVRPNVQQGFPEDITQD